MASTAMKNVIDGHRKYFGKKLQSNLDKIRSVRAIFVNV
jgi:hypothetical protein